MTQLVFMLSAPRSFSSLISTMLGQHPQIYGFPELTIMASTTVGERLRRQRSLRRPLGPHGLLRTIAELEFGEQTPQTILAASNWLEDRSDWDSADVLNHLVKLAGQQTGALYCLEKAPVLTLNPSTLLRLRKNWPDARYIHLVRHPVNFEKSLDEFFGALPRLSAEQVRLRKANTLTVWSVINRNILDFCATEAPERCLRLRGEDVLGDPETSMRAIAEWLGLDTDPASIQATLHPEDSPYAQLGPFNAPYGNDPKFIDSPAFRPGRPRLGNLAEFLNGERGLAIDVPRRAFLRQFAGCMGYQ